MSRRNRYPKGPMQVTVVSGENGGGQGAKIERIIDSLGKNEGDCMVLCNYFKPVPIGTTGGPVYLTIDDIVASDELAAFKTQFRTFRVSHAKYTVTDMNPSSAAAPNVWATAHGANATGYVYNDVIDQSDSKVMAPGSGQLTFYWSATSLPEKEFQSWNSYANWGGLTGFVDGSTTPVATKYMLVGKFIVHLRGRY